MIEVTTFKAEDMDRLNEQKATAYLRPHFESIGKVFERCKYAYSMKVNGRLVASFGLNVFWPGRGEAWAVLDKDCKREFIHIHRAVTRAIDVIPVRRIEASVDAHFEPGHRWVKALGFQLEAPLRRAYWPNGGDTALYAKVKEA